MRMGNVNLRKSSTTKFLISLHAMLLTMTMTVLCLILKCDLLAVSKYSTLHLRDTVQSVTKRFGDEKKKEKTTDKCFYSLPPLRNVKC